ncbi:hypothetical protein M3J09_002104 [Ascochyta lentis]
MRSLLVMLSCSIVTSCSSESMYSMQAFRRTRRQDMASMLLVQVAIAGSVQMAKGNLDSCSWLFLRFRPFMGGFSGFPWWSVVDVGSCFCCGWFTCRLRCAVCFVRLMMLMSCVI